MRQHHRHLQSIPKPLEGISSENKKMTTQINCLMKSGSKLNKISFTLVLRDGHESGGFWYHVMYCKFEELYCYATNNTMNVPV